MASSSYSVNELEDLYANIEIEGEDDVANTFEFEESEVEITNAELCIVGRFLTARAIDYDVMRHIMASLWQPGKGMYVKQLESNRFLFQFYHEIDLNRVIEGSPWTFNRIQFVFTKLKPTDDPRLVPLNSLDIWVQVHGLQYGFKSENVLKRAGNYIGTFVESDRKNFRGIWRDYMRVQVTLNVTVPLKRRTKLRRTAGDEEKFCPKRFDVPTDQLAQPYGIWMKAQPRRRHHLIGSQWLCNGDGDDVESTDGSPLGENRQQSTIKALLIKEPIAPDQGALNNHRINLGKSKGVIVPEIMQPLYGNMSTSPRESPLDTLEEELEDNVIVDSKRRRTRLERESTVINLVQDEPTGGNNDGISNEVMEEDTATCPPITMSVLSWNCRGLGNTWTFRFLVDLVIQKKPNFLFLCETLSNNIVLERLRVKLGFEGLYSVDSRGHSGGVAMLWRNNIEAQLLRYSTNFIDIQIESPNSTPWRLTGLYGEPNREQRHHTWNLIRNLQQLSTLPWCIIGDLNNVTSHNDKRGGNNYPQRLIDGFNQTLSDCRLIDLDIVGYPFTWERGRGTPNLIEVRLDRALVSHSWTNFFTTAQLFNLELTASDHCPILLQPTVQHVFVPAHQFRFENALLHEPLCFQVVKKVWEAHTDCNILERLRICGENLAVWGRDYTGNFKQRISKCKAEIKRWKRGRDTESIKKYDDAQKLLSEIMNQREVFWRQRSKQLWLREGDQNSKFFHAKATSRKKNNAIHSLQNDSRAWVNWEIGLDSLIVDYFQNLFVSTNSDFNDVVLSIVPSITTVKNESLLAPITDEEVKKALFQMRPDKSPDPDGMTPGFYQKYWSIVGRDVINQVKEFFATCSLPHGINRTNIVLIPKKKQPCTMSDLRPISLCNVLYKVISKVLANRLKIVLHTIISEQQSAFILGRLISDNIMIAFEVMHYLKRKRKGKEGCMALKLDLSKAYDWVEWDFIRAMMIRMGFASYFVDLILQTLTSVEYNVVHRGKSLGAIIPHRGICQGDPLSSYLFLICAEGLSSLIRRFEGLGHIKGCKVANGAPIISYMLFADDSYIYCRGTEREASNRICSLLRMEIALENSTYLGLPCTMGQNKNAILGFLREKMQKRIQSWEGRFLSKAGREILLKTVAQALPSYAMSVFLLPVDTCSSLESMMSKYWWNTSNQNSRGISWMSWKQLTKQKDDGGMGFRSLRDYNFSLLGKQGCRLLTHEQSLVSRVYKARYYPHGSFLTATLGSNPSFIWKSIFESQDLVKAGARIRIGSVNQLMKINQRERDVEVISDIFNSRDAQIILQIPLSAQVHEDAWYWSKEATGFYSVKSAYKHIQDSKGNWANDEGTNFWKKYWKIKVPLKVLHFAWRDLTDCLATQVQLQIKHVPVATTCVFCNDAAKTTLHLFVECPFSKSCWNRSAISLPTSNCTSFFDWFSAIWSRHGGGFIEEILMSCRFEPLHLNSNCYDSNESWTKPDDGMIKVNVDGATFETSNSFGTGLIARDSKGAVILASSTFSNGFYNAPFAEIISIKEALSWIKDSNLSNVVIETDCLTAVQALQSQVDMPSMFGIVVKDCKVLLSSLFNVIVSHVKRSGNKAAHCLARGSCFWSDRKFSESTLPSTLKSIVIADLI
uniref:Reverse transcriptase domain-containing protein n=1 Tax=Cannabis sativa TaxID=3483 RepID=A0A803PR19_CANSA